MASGKCIYLEKALLDLVLGQTAWTPPTSLYFALSTAAFASTTTGTSLLTTEVSTSGTGYTRLGFTNDSTLWPLADGSGQKIAVPNIQWATVTATYGTVRSVYILDGNARSSADHVLYGCDLTPTAVPTGPGPSFAAGQFIMKET